MKVPLLIVVFFPGILLVIAWLGLWRQGDAIRNIWARFALFTVAALLITYTLTVGVPRLATPGAVTLGVICGVYVGRAYEQARLAHTEGGLT